jgi:hypothetical protein
MIWTNDDDFPELFQRKSPPAVKVTPGRYPYVHDSDQAAVTLIEPDMRRGPWIAGGAPLHWETGKSVELHHDIDVWFRDQEQFDQTMIRVREHATLICQTDNAHTYQHYHGAFGTHTIQLICANFFDSAQAIIDHFDFSVCQIVTDGVQVLYGEHTRADISDRRLRITQSRPNAAKRISKYLAYGFKMSLDELQAQFSAIDDWVFTHEDYEAVKL